jgi:hypothetical protein
MHAALRERYLAGIPRPKHFSGSGNDTINVETGSTFAVCSGLGSAYVINARGKSRR